MAAGTRESSGPGGRALLLTLLVVLATLTEMALSAPVQDPRLESVTRIKRQFGGFRQQGGHNRPGHQRPGHNRPGGGFQNQPGGALINKPGGVGNLQSSSGIAGAQAFQNQSPLGSFGASSANAGTQSLNFRPGGFSGTAGMSISQNYQLPGGGSASVSITDGLSVDSQGGTSNSHGSSIAITPPKRPMGFNNRG